MKFNTCFILSVLVLSFLSCNDDEEMFNNGDYFIEAEIDQVLKRCDVFPAGSPSTSTNPLFPPSTTKPNVTMIMRSSIDSTVFWKLWFAGDGHPDTWIYPKTIPGIADFFVDEWSSIRYGPASGEEIGQCFYVPDFTLILASFEDRTFEGTFSGKIVDADNCNENPDEVHSLTNGQFRVKL